MRRHELTEAEWATLAPLLPPQKPATGRPAEDHRGILNAILWKVRTGAPWRDLPERYGSWSTVHSRFRRWRLAGVWDRLFAAVQQQADAAGQLDWDVHFVDSTVIRAHQHAAGAKRGGPASQALGRSQGGFSTKVHLRAEGHGKLLTVLLTPGQQHESTMFEPLLEQGAVRRPGRGRPRVRPHRVVGDKAYTGRRTRAYCRRRGIRYTIPRQKHERRRGPFDRQMYRRRHLVENLIARCKQFRSLATRYDKLADTFRTLWVIAATVLWIRT